MEANAAMLEAMDYHIGRLVEHLRETGELDNTVFIVTSDNGPEPSRGDTDPRLAFWMNMNGYHLDLEGVGEKGSWGFIGPEWAMAAASPFDKFKFLGAEGGVRVPLIVSGAGIPEGCVSRRVPLSPTLRRLCWRWPVRRTPSATLNR